MKRARTSLIIIGVLALLTFVLVAGVLTAAQKKTPVVVAARALEAGTRLSLNDVEVKQIHVGAALEGTFIAPEEIVGLVTTVQRLPGDQLTAGMVGDAAQNALAQGLDPDHRAVAVHVDQASGLAGLLRPGDAVSAIAIVDPTSLGMGVQAIGAEAKVMLTGLKVLFVPWEFRYRELNVENDDSGMAPVVASSSGREDGVVVLSAPLAPITVTWALTPTSAVAFPTPTPAPTEEITGTGRVMGTTSVTDTVAVDANNPMLRFSPVELLALLDAHAQIYLALEPSGPRPEDQGPSVAGMDIDTPGVFLSALVPEEIIARQGRDESLGFVGMEETEND